MSMPQKLKEFEEMPEPTAEEHALSEMIPTREIPGMVKNEQERARETMQTALGYFERMAEKIPAQRERA